MEQHNVVSPDEWLDARLELLKKEKEMTRLRDAIAAQRRALPWLRIDKEYVFDAPEGPVSLSDLFDGRSQLIVKHYMMAPGQKTPCVDGTIYYNYEHRQIPMEDLSGRSVFYRNENGEILHTYSAFGRGSEELLTTYVFLDLTPRGRDENGPYHSLSDWVRPHDMYGNGGWVESNGRYHPVEVEADLP